MPTLGAPASLPKEMGAESTLTTEDSSNWLNRRVMKVNTYIQLSQRMGEVSVEAAERGLALVDRVALLVRGSAGNT